MSKISQSQYIFTNKIKFKMDLSVDLFYEDENHDANVLCIRGKIRDDSNSLEVSSAK